MNSTYSASGLNVCITDCSTVSGYLLGYKIIFTKIWSIVANTNNLCTECHNTCTVG